MMCRRPVWIHTGYETCVKVRIRYVFVSLDSTTERYGNTA